VTILVEKRESITGWEKRRGVGKIKGCQVLSMKMLINLSVLTLALALLIQGGANAQTGSGKSGIKARGRGTKLILTSRGKSHVLDVSRSVDAAKLNEVDVLFATSRPGFTYLLIDACGPSRLESNDRQCGGGQECNLLWVKLNTGWKISDIKATRYESCWAPVTMTSNGFNVKGNTLQMEYSNSSEDKNYKLTYDADRPESGFAIEESDRRETN
jgi:hypothetical protein